MASYDDLQTDIAAWINRTDLTAQIPGFIRIAESRIALDVRVLQQIEPVQLTQAVGETHIATPADWLEWDELSLDGNALDYVVPRTMYEYIAAGGPSGKYTMLGTRLIVAGEAQADILVDATYYKRLTPLSSSGTNWLADNHPAVYLYGALTSAYAYVGDDARAAQYGGAYQALVTDINSNAVKQRASSSAPWRQRPR